MPNWILFVLGAVIVWGVWGVVLKMAVDRLGPHTVWMVHSFSFAVWVTIYKLAAGFKFNAQMNGILLTVVAALLGSAGGLLMLMALSKSKASTVMPLVALYPALTVLLSFVLLRESLTGSQWAGVGFAIAAGVLLGR